MKSLLQEMKMNIDRLMSTIMDRRMSYFNPSTGGSSSVTSTYSCNIKNTLKDYYGKKCFFCGVIESTDTSITKAHLIAINDKTDFKFFRKPKYKTDFKRGSVKNYIFLCGNKGISGTCHDEFDNYLIAIVHNVIESSYNLFCFRKEFKKYKELHNKEVFFHEKHVPYHRVMCWRTIYSLNNQASFIEKTQFDNINSMVLLSEKVFYITTIVFSFNS